MTLPLFGDSNYTLTRESPETYREFQHSEQGEVTAGWEMLVPETAADGVPYQFIFVGPASEHRGTAIRLRMATKEGGEVPGDTDVLLEAHYKTGSERTVMFQGKYSEFTEVADQYARDAAIALQRRAEVGEEYIIRLSVKVPEGGPTPDPSSDDSYFELECVKLWWNEAA